MKIDETKIESARLIEKIEMVCRDGQGNQKDYFRFSIFITFLATLKLQSENDVFLNNKTARSLYLSHQELIDEAISKDAPRYKDKRLEALTELFQSFIRFNQSVFSEIEPTFPVVPRNDCSILIEVVRSIYDSIRISEYNSFTKMFDDLAIYLFNKFGDYDSNRISALSIVPNTVFGKYIDRIVDYFPFSADAAVESLKYHDFPPEIFFGENRNQYAFEYWMRTFIHGIEIKKLGQKPFLGAVDMMNSVGVMDPIFAPSRTHEFWAKYLSDYPKEKGVPAEFIASQVLTNDGPEHSVVVVPARDISRRGSFSETMKKIVVNGCVLAVIDLPLGKKEKTRWSLWILRNTSSERCSGTGSEVLFIAPDALKNLTFVDDVDQIYYFASLIVKQVIYNVPSTEQEKNLKNSFYEFFLNNFSDEYRDVEGLCRLVSVDEMRANEYRLAARYYVKPVLKDNHIPGLDSRVLHEAIEQNQGKGKCYFLIGDNGEGKSITLSKLADYYVKKGRMSFAVSFGPTDRFRYAKKIEKNNEFYRYLGGRTSHGGTASKDLSTEIARRLIEGGNDIRRKLFISLAGRIGFTADYFLIPHLSGGSELAPENNLSHIIKIFSSEVEDRALLDRYKDLVGKDKRSFQLGLKRDADSNLIIPFKELSSGEQQILNLLSKLVFNAQSDSIFFVDEPEISLHVSWQRAIPKLLADISRQFNCDIVVATHSPILVSEAIYQGSVCFSSKSRVIKKMDSVEHNSIETVLFEYFKTNTLNNREIHERCASILSKAIKLGNSSVPIQDAEEKFIEDLERMISIINKSRYADDNSALSGLDIIEKTKQAIKEVLRVSSEVQGSIYE